MLIDHDAHRGGGRIVESMTVMVADTLPVLSGRMDNWISPHSRVGVCESIVDV